MFQIVRLLLPSILITVCFATLFASGLAQLEVLPDDEVQALHTIFLTLGKKDWDFTNLNPCINGTLPPMNDTTKKQKEFIAVNCSSCQLVNGDQSYHVVGILLKGQNLTGTLPPDLVKLPCLQIFDVTRNYLNGSIPTEWSSMQRLEEISLLGNRLTGTIPGALANITTLKRLTVEFNQLYGEVPLELGTMSSIEKLSLSSNNFTGVLAPSFANLTSLQDFRISDNQFSGQIPSYIQNWKNLSTLYIQGSGLMGPIPSLDLLKKLSDLRISDLNGSDQVTFPLKSIDVSQWKILVLRNCSLTGPLPDATLPSEKSLSTLDLSFNRLSGIIPNSFENSLPNVERIYLTGNLLSGPIPGWILKGGKNIDLSYNNFTSPELSDLSSNCQYNNGINLFASSSMDKETTSNIVSCLRSLPERCPKNPGRYNLHINCGGRQVTVNKSIEFYADDGNPGGDSKFFLAQDQYWSSSSTGRFLDDRRPNIAFILSNLSRLSKDTINPELYMNARVSPLSLTYYAFCLVSGNYTIRLHFAEIVFTDDETYSSLGRRIFDVYIQGERVLKDFNIVKAANGVLKPTIQIFKAVVTNSGTLEIRFYWAGKGTTDIPSKGDYGPLISAISVNSEETPSISIEETPSSVSVGARVGIIVAGAFAIMLFIVAILWWKGCLGQRSSSTEHDLRGLDLKTGTFTLRQIKTATNNFDVGNKIGEGGFGSVYKGVLSDGTMMAVKQLSSKSKQGNREFLNEIGMISALQHPHLVKLYGCCVEGNQLLLVYEYMENNSLARALFGPEEYQLQLDWPTRHRICVGIARGLAYLHEESRLKIVHRDIKATNVLLDKNLNPKISDFGLAKLDEEDNTHISTRIAGTYGYMAPEYAMRGYLTDKADVYSFGIVALEIVSGKSNTSHRPKEESLHLLDWAHLLKKKGNLLNLVDPTLGSNYKEEEVMHVINVALLCANVSAAVRPTMSSVVSMLEGGAAIPELGPTLSIEDDEMKEKALWEHFLDKKESSRSENSQSQSLLMDGPFTGSSTSAVDLYPINVDSSYWEKRV